ncbi:hypothetical protein D0817_05785 [Flavobacterium cupreum]|uniref:Uncharacterized protein n=1 Tax=Flavobacterium cupreum TaxID=2133766 RepID=A0A434AAL1_9FLAO|nr:hypothetical protein D0817_05785 [Flavobacterium cupreum]
MTKLFLFQSCDFEEGEITLETAQRKLPIFVDYECDLLRLLATARVSFVEMTPNEKKKSANPSDSEQAKQSAQSARNKNIFNL